MADEFRAEVDHWGNHVAIRVKDFAAALHFYNVLLGLPIERRRGAAENPDIVWMPGVQITRRAGEIPDGQYGVLDHIGIAVKNLDAICARLDAAGCTIERPRNQLHFAELGRDVVTIFYRDPDGNVVELLEWQV
jgi:catechol 2,3-dioxygenase-like lactoylglutathione lyase family enzyme